jgi:hypothetical protein
LAALSSVTSNRRAWLAHLGICFQVFHIAEAIPDTFTELQERQETATLPPL